MMSNEASAHLYTLGNNICIRKNCSTNIFLFKANISNIRKRCEICSKLRIKTPELRSSSSSVFIVNFEHIYYFFVVFVLTLNK